MKMNQEERVRIVLFFFLSFFSFGSNKIQNRSYKVKNGDSTCIDLIETQISDDLRSEN